MKTLWHSIGGNQIMMKGLKEVEVDVQSSIPERLSSMKLDYQICLLEGEGPDAETIFTVDCHKFLLKGRSAYYKTFLSTTGFSDISRNYSTLHTDFFSPFALTVAVSFLYDKSFAERMFVTNSVVYRHLDLCDSNRHRMSICDKLPGKETLSPYLIDKCFEVLRAAQYLGIPDLTVWTWKMLVRLLHLQTCSPYAREDMPSCSLLVPRFLALSKAYEGEGLMDRQNDDDCLERIAWTDNILMMWGPQFMDLGEEIMQNFLVIFRKETERLYGTETLFQSLSKLVLHRNRAAAYEEYPEWHRKLTLPTMKILVELAAMGLDYPTIVPSHIACLAGPRSVQRKAGSGTGRVRGAHNPCNGPYLEEKLRENLLHGFEAPGCL
ncbi:hypothetical protein RUND412_009969 [Rhizina undulata]